MEDDKVTILGAGSWGSALACLLAGKGIAVTVWDRDPELVAEIQTLGQNPKYLQMWSSAHQSEHNRI